MGHLQGSVDFMSVPTKEDKRSGWLTAPLILLFLLVFSIIYPIDIHASEIKVDFSVEPIEGKGIIAGELATIKVKLTDSTSGEPKTSMRPSLWISLLRGEDKMPCRERVSTYLKGSIFGSGADIDLNKYFILTLNNDPTISVIDPFVTVKGLTQLYTMVMLKSPGDDWAIEGNRLFVSMPQSNQIAVIDTERFKVITNIDAGEHPMRLAIQPDRKYLWVTNCTKSKETSGVTAIDLKELKVITRIMLEPGHHEIVFSEDGRYLYVSNIDNGMLSITDTVDLRLIKEIKTGRSPVSLYVSGKKVYIAHSDGSVVIIDAKDHKISGKIETAQGLSAMKFSHDGRWGFVINPEKNNVYVIDSSKDILVHTLKINNPLNISFTKSSAYILKDGGNEMVVINLSELGREGPPDMLNVSLNAPPSPRMPQMHAHTNPMFPAPEGDVMLIARHGLIHYYKEGMQSPMGSFRSYTRSLKAINVFDRSLKEKEPGIYEANIRIPESGKYEAALLAGSHAECFDFTALPNPVLAKRERLKIEFINPQKKVKAGEPVSLRFRLINPTKNEPENNIEDVIVTASLAPGHKQDTYKAKLADDGIYEVIIKTESPGIYYIFFSVPSLNVRSDHLPFLSIQAGE